MYNCKLNGGGGDEVPAFNDTLFVVVQSSETPSDGGCKPENFCGHVSYKQGRRILLFYRRNKGGY